MRALIAKVHARHVASAFVCMVAGVEIIAASLVVHACCEMLSRAQHSLLERTR